MEFDKVNDSGVREDMDTGSKRDTQVGKGRQDLLPPWCLRRDARHYENGAAKYGDGNWLLGQLSSRYMASLFRHVCDYMEGDRSEDHLAAIRWNAGGLMTNEEFVERGIYPPEMDDMNNFLDTEGFEPTKKKFMDDNRDRVKEAEHEALKPIIKALAEFNGDVERLHCADCRSAEKSFTDWPCCECRRLIPKLLRIDTDTDFFSEKDE